MYKFYSLLLTSLCFLLESLSVCVGLNVCSFKLLATWQNILGSLMVVILYTEKNNKIYIHSLTHYNLLHLFLYLYIWDCVCVCLEFYFTFHFHVRSLLRKYPKSEWTFSLVFCFIFFFFLSKSKRFLFALSSCSLN